MHALSLSTLYILCFFAALAGLIYGAVLLHVPQTWIVVGGLVANGVGILWASSYTTAGGPPRP